VKGAFWLAVAAAASFGTIAWAQGALADGSGARDVRSVFFVAKSENRNQVHYGIHLDRSCAPVGDRPVFAYWRMFERGPEAIEPVLPVELQAYGVLDQQVVSRAEGGGRVRVTVAALHDRVVAIDTAASADGCTATAKTSVGGVPASLWSVYVRLRWPFGVDSLTLAGRALADGRIVEEKIRP
jgi:hypothetical protein